MPPPEMLQGGSFLITPDDESPIAPGFWAAMVEPPISPRDLLSEEDEPESGVLSSDCGRALQNLGAALSWEKPTHSPPAKSLMAPPLSVDLEPGDLGPITLATPPKPLLSSVVRERSDDMLILTEPLFTDPNPVIDSREERPTLPDAAKVAAELNTPIIQEAPAFSLPDLAQPATEKPTTPETEIAKAPPVAEKPDSKPSLLAFPAHAAGSQSPAREELITFPPTRPAMSVAATPEPELAEEEEHDFNAPPLFLVPSVLPGSSRGLPEAAITAPDPAEADGSLGATLAGALLIAGGIFLVSRVPSLAGEVDKTLSSIDASTEVLGRAALIRGEIFISAVAGAFCLIMGIGAATLRRWAPPVIHAAGWVMLLTALLGLGVGTAALFHFSGNGTAGDASPGDATAVFAVVGIAGVALPLLLIAIFQGSALAQLCAAVDKRARWTDCRNIPSLMVVLTGLLLCTAASTMWLANARFPLFTEWELKHASNFWAGTALAGLAGTILTAAGKRAGWALLVLLVLTLGADLYLTCAAQSWQTLFPGQQLAPGTTVGALLAASTMLPPLVILLMMRKSLAPAHPVH